MSSYGLKFDNRAIRELPLDTIQENYVRSVSNSVFSRVKPTPMANPTVVVVSQPALDLIGIKYDPEDKSFAEFFSGNQIMPGSETYSHCYCGHQFGVFAGQLGDGAAIYLGEVVNGEKRIEVQLKGSGLTPYSRTADGRKVLRSSIREFLASEAMAALGVPTTRASSCIVSSETVIRDIFYDGHPKHEKISVITRLADTFFRFGSFEIFKTVDAETGRRGPSVGRFGIKKQLLDFIVKNYYSHVMVRNGRHPDSDPTLEDYLGFYKEITVKTAELVAFWQTIGFCHGVLNTDNMSITGLTLDYGPFGFMDRFDPNHVCNTSDDSGRYSYKNQPAVCKWNLMKLAEAITGGADGDLIPMADMMKILEETYEETYLKFYLDKMANKIGLIGRLDRNTQFDGHEILSDENLIQELLSIMASTGADFTVTFRSFNMSRLPKSSQKPDEEFIQAIERFKQKLISVCCSLKELKDTNDAVVKSRDMQIFLMLITSSPTMLEQIGLSRGSIDRMMSHLEQRDKLKEMTEESKKASDEESWSSFIVKYSHRLSFDVSKLASGDSIDSIVAKRMSDMNANNPRVILRNHLAQNVIEAAESGDYGPVNEFVAVLMNPYDEPSTDACPRLAKYYESPPEDAPKIRVSCSS